LRGRSPPLAGATVEFLSRSHHSKSPHGPTHCYFVCLSTMFQTQSSPLKLPSNVSLTKVPVRCSNPIVAPNAPLSVKVPRMSCGPRGNLIWPIPTLLLTVIVTATGRHRPDVAVAEPSHRPSNGSAQASPTIDKNNNEATDATRRRRFILSSRYYRTTAPFPKFVIRCGNLDTKFWELLTELAAAVSKLQFWRHQPSPPSSLAYGADSIRPAKCRKANQKYHRER